MTLTEENGHGPVTGCAECARLRRANTGLQLDLQLANKEVAKLRRQLSTARNAERDRRRDSPEHEIIETLYEFWKKECNHPNAELGPKREQAVRVRLEARAHRPGSDLKQAAHDICLAIRGARVDAYVDGKGVRHDDLELICRNEVKLESFIARYQKWKEQHGH